MKRGRIGTIVAFVLCVAGAGWWVARTRSLPEKPRRRTWERSSQKRIASARSSFPRCSRLRSPTASSNASAKQTTAGTCCARTCSGMSRPAIRYGISGYDGWGCQISTDLRVKVHQYDCFDLTKPACSTGATVFHGDCVGPVSSTDESGRRFDTPEHQIASNGDAGRHLVVKMDVEGAEWDTFLQTPDGVFELIDQLVVEFHGVNRQRYIDVVKKLKRFYYVANLHHNNYSCDPSNRPFRSWAFEVLLVSKRLGVPDRSGKRPVASALDAPNNPKNEDCQ